MNILVFAIIANTAYRITKLMGESFKLHSQALAGYEDALMAEAQDQTPEVGLVPHAAEVAAF